MILPLIREEEKFNFENKKHIKIELEVELEDTP